MDTEDEGLRRRSTCHLRLDFKMKLDKICREYTRMHHRDVLYLQLVYNLSTKPRTFVAGDVQVMLAVYQVIFN